MLFTVVGILLTASPTSGARGLATARELVDQFQFGKALAVINDTLKEPGLDTATLISLYELEGIAHATNGASNPAREAFARLLTLDPSHPLPAELPPKVRTLYFGAKTIAQREALELVAEEPTRTGGRIERLEVNVKTSALLPATGVRFTVKADDAPEQVKVVPLDGAHQPSVEVKGAHVKWSAELLGARDAVLRRVERDEVPPLDAPPPPPVVAVSPAPSTHWVRPVGIAVGVGGLAAVGVGVWQGLQSADARAKIAGAQTNADGVVVGLTQAEAARLDATARNSALAANVLMVAGGVLTAAGLVMVVLGQDDAPTAVSFSAGPAGVMAAGRF